MWLTPRLLIFFSLVSCLLYFTSLVPLLSQPSSFHHPRSISLIIPTSLSKVSLIATPSTEISLLVNMAGGIAGTTDVGRVEAPVTLKAYLMCAFAAFGGIFFGFDSGYINGVMAMDYFIQTFENLVSSQK